MPIRSHQTSNPHGRDIRPELRARLEAAKDGRQAAQEALRFHTAEVTALTDLLALEDRRFAADEVRQPQESLTDFILEKLGEEPMTKELLRNLCESAGYDVDGRSIHATL